MNERIEQLLSVIPPYLNETIGELCQLMYMDKRDNHPPIELTQTFADVDASEQATM
jgi:hypothetical protein